MDTKKPGYRGSRAVAFGADNGARTRDPNLGKVVLYQLSHVRLRGLVLRDARILCKNFFCKVLRRSREGISRHERRGQTQARSEMPLHLTEHDPGRAVLREPAVCKR